jgi:hypothetical protein
MTINVHTFESTGEAYDATQTDDAIKDGDVLVVPSENVVGFLAKAWPVALSAEHGAFHTLEDGADVSCLMAAEAKTLTYTVHPPGGEPYETTETYPAKPGTDYTASAQLAAVHMENLR